MRILLFLATIASFISPAFTFACGSNTDCKIDDRHYRVRMPKGYVEGTKIGAIVYAHGFGGSAHGIMKNASMTRLANELGVAIIAAKSAAADWSIPGAPSKVTLKGVDELAYFDDVIADATRRFPIDGNRLMMTGFSAGGMMVWTLACHRSEMFAGFAPMAGTFWQPEPVTCDTPAANIVHIHGNADKIVPLKGRKVMDTHQGDVAKVLKMYSAYGNYSATDETTIGSLSCDNSKNGDGNILNFCLYSGGHTFKSEYVKQAWQILEAAGKL